MDRNWARIALWAAGLLVAAWLLRRFSTLVTVAIVCGMITFPIYPVVDWLERRWHLSRGLAAGLTLLGVLAVLTLGVFSVVPWIAYQVQVLLTIAPRGIRAVNDFLAHWQTRVAEPTFPQYLRAAWEQIGETAVGAANATVSRVVSTAVNWFGRLYLLLLVPFIIYFVLLDYEQIRRAILGLVREPARTRVETLLGKLTMTLRWGLWAQVVVSSIVGTLTAVGLWLLRIPGALAIGVFGGIAEAIPYIGGFATYGVVLLAAAPLGGTVWVWGMVVVTVVKLLSNVLVPLVLGRMTRTHPLAIITALLALGQLFGVLGMFFAVPVVVVAKEFLAWWQEGRTAPLAAQAGGSSPPVEPAPR
ncbi:MAG: AI-2E family transporter [Armatimonadota bacterium]|nr:AI-2E family transporter [Armatimonadota bacterium]